MELVIKVQLDDEQMEMFLKSDRKISHLKGLITKANRRMDQIEKLWRDQNEG